jgi:poly-gamma-glutamate synthesis protein (capsule biosynthesis protein)
MAGDEITLFLSGDVMTGRGIDQVMAHPVDPVLQEPWVKSALDYVSLAEQRNGPIPRPVDGAYIWGDALAMLEAHSPEVRIINLETAISERGQPWPHKGINYRMAPAHVDCLTVPSIDCCVLANNHTLDYAAEGLIETLEALAGAGIRVAGAGRDAASAEAPAAIDVSGGKRVVIFAVGAASSGIPHDWSATVDRPGVAWVDGLGDRDIDSVVRRIEAATSRSDIVILSVHWGPNWGYGIPVSHRRFAHALIEQAGVDVVHGHSSHHPLGVEVYAGRPILYGCGDLINDYEGIRGHEEYRTELRLLYFVTVDGRGALQRLRVIPVRARRFRLETAGGDDVAWVESLLAREGRTLGTGADALDGTHAVDIRW